MLQNYSLQQVLNEQAPFFAVEEPNNSDGWKKNPRVHKDDKINPDRWRDYVETVHIVPASVRQVRELDPPPWALHQHPT